jgi:hypothetical protein
LRRDKPIVPKVLGRSQEPVASVDIGCRDDFEHLASCVAKADVGQPCSMQTNDATRVIEQLYLAQIIDLGQ